MKQNLAMHNEMYIIIQSMYKKFMIFRQMKLIISGFVQSFV